MTRGVCPEYRSPDLNQYKLAHEHEIRCPKCRAGSNCISSKWLRGMIELKCICGFIWELFIDKGHKKPAATAPAPARVPVPESGTMIRRCRRCQGLYEAPKKERYRACPTCQPRAKEISPCQA